ncbi:MAG TPA: phosphohistidine phosphatase SixA [Nitrososphaerales archaeon]|nr:phosphohistidine phosphatase SixA [Nitrososphaerales archaeon]
MELYLMRHGEAGKRIPVAARDTARALTAAGRQEVEDVGQAMAKLGYEFDVVATSPLKRAKETATIVSEALKQKNRVEEWSELSPEGNRGALYRRLTSVRPGSKVLCVGHEPYLTIAMGEIAGRGGDGSAGFRISLKKGGMAKLLVTGFNPKISGELRWLLTPKQIRRMS